MRRFVTAVCVAGAMLLVSVPAAFASSHGAMPAGLSLWDQASWEVQHYLIHMQMTFEAIRAWFVSPELGWALLNDQTLCATQGHLTEHLFDTGMHALVSFFSTLVVLAWVGVEAASHVLNFIFRKVEVRSTA